MTKNAVCYLDNAATTYPKPERVINEVEKCMRTYCGNPGRGAHSLSLAAANKIYDCRCAAARLIRSDMPENIFFVPNTTYGLNMIIKGILKDGDHVIISDMEHNSVYRPVYKMAMEGKISFDVFNALGIAEKEKPSAEKICSEIQKLIKKNTKLLICNHSSNICSFSLPIEEIGKLCKRNNIIFAIDAAQSAGHSDLNIRKMQINFLCAPGHKALYGPQGSGFVAINDDNTILETLIEGGNGIESLSGEMPLFSPERYESGTVSTPCIAGLCEGIGEVLNIGVNTIGEYENFLFDRLLDNLCNIKNITVYAPEYKGGTLLFNISGFASDAVASVLNKQGICVRGGFHCTALAHKSLKTPSHGAVRASFGIFNTVEDIDKLSYACGNIKSLLDGL